MIVWGGFGAGGNLSDGGRYNPTTDTWQPVTAIVAPQGRSYHTAVWTGTEMVIWGGYLLGNPAQNYFNDGGRYDPASDSWSSPTTNGAPARRGFHTAIWNGSEMILWAGVNYDAADHYLNDGGRYSPITDSWKAMSTAGAPVVRESHTSVWSGSEMIVWGGYSPDSADQFLNDGGRYNPTTDSWGATSASAAPAGRESHTAVWTGREMIIWGGYDGSVYLNDPWSYLPGPSLRVVPTGANSVAILWQNLFTGFGLQQNTTLESTNWAAVSNAPAQVGDDWQVVISPADGNRFYRLHKATLQP